MTPFEIVLVIYGGVLSVTALSVVYRMIVGPTILDRAISTDMLVVLVVIGMALYTASAKAPWAGPSMLGLTGLAFIGTVAFARFVAREDIGARTARRSGESTATGAFVAIDPDRYDHAAAPQREAALEAGAEDDPDAVLEAVGARDRGPVLGAGAVDGRGDELEDVLEDDLSDETGFGADPSVGRGFSPVSPDEQGFDERTPDEQGTDEQGTDEQGTDEQEERR